SRLVLLQQCVKPSLRRFRARGGRLIGMHSVPQRSSGTGPTKHVFKSAPGCCVLGKIADSLYSVLQVSAIEPRQVPARHADGVEDVLVSSCEDLEQDQILRRRKRNEATEQSFLDGAAVRRLLEWKRGEDDVELEWSVTEPQGSRCMEA